MTDFAHRTAICLFTLFVCIACAYLGGSVAVSISKGVPVRMKHFGRHAHGRSDAGRAKQGEKREKRQKLVSSEGGKRNTVFEPDWPGLTTEYEIVDASANQAGIHDASFTLKQQTLQPIMTGTEFLASEVTA